MFLVAPVATAAGVTVGGRVLTAEGRGIRNARVLLTGTTGETRSALTNPFGYYRFYDVPAGEIYIFSVSAKRFHFQNSTQVLSITEDLENLDFVANP